MKRVLSGILSLAVSMSMLSQAAFAKVATEIINGEDGAVIDRISEDFNDFASTKTNPQSKDSDYCQPEGWYLAHRWSSQVAGFLRPATDAEKGAVMQVGSLGNDGASSHAYLPLNKTMKSGMVTISFDMKPERATNMWNGSFAHTQTPNLIVMAYPDGIDSSDTEWASGNSLSIGKHSDATTDDQYGRPIAGIFSYNISAANDPAWESMTSLKTLTMDAADKNKVSVADSKWYSVKIELDFDTGTTNYYLDGSKTVGATLAELDIDGVQGISFGINSNAVDASTLIDNVKVENTYNKAVKTVTVKSENFDDFASTKTNPQSKDSDYCQPEGWYLAHRWSSQVVGFLRPATDAEKGAVMQVGSLGNDGASSHAYLPLDANIKNGVVSISFDMKPERATNMWNGSYTHTKTPNLIVMAYPDGIDSSDTEWASGNSLSIGKHSGATTDDQYGRPLTGIFAYNISTANDPAWESMTVLKALTMDSADASKVSAKDSKWYSVKIELDFENGTTNYYLDGTKTVGATLAELDIDGIQGISFGTNSNAVDASTLIDNVSVKHQKAISDLSFTEFTLVDDKGTEVSYKNANTGEKFYLSTSVENISQQEKQLLLVLAKYNDGVLEETDFQKVELEAGEKHTCGIDTTEKVAVSSPSDAEDYYKIFAFDAQSFVPFIEAETYYDGERISLLFDNSERNTAALKQPPLRIMNEEYLPLSYMAGLAGYTATDNGKTVILEKDDENITIQQGANVASINGTETVISDSPIKRDGEMLVTVDVIEELLPIGEDVTAYDKGVALHSEYYDDTDTFFNLVTTFTGDPKTQRGFSWEAMPQYDNMVLEYSEENHPENAVTVKAVSEMYPVIYGYTNQNAETTEGISFYDNMLFYKAAAENLKPGTTYSYRIGDTVKDEWSEEYSFTTEAEENSGFSMIAVADSQEQTVSGFEYYKNTVDKAVAENPEAAFMVHLGDIVENGMCDDWWNMFFNASKGINEELPIVPVVGNHETRINGTKYFNLHFNNPQNGIGLVSESYDYSKVKKVEANVIRELDNTVYSFDYGNTHFAVLNTGTDWAAEDWATNGLAVLELQKEWLKNDMKKADENGAKWKVLLMHIGVYTARDRKSAYQFYKTIDECGIDLVLSGHDHVTMRTKPVFGDKVVEENGSIYAIMGAAGTKRYGFNSGNYTYINTDKTAVSPTETGSKNPTYNILSFTDNAINVTAKALDGTVIDTFSITK